MLQQRPSSMARLQVRCFPGRRRISCLACSPPSVQRLRVCIHFLLSCRYSPQPRSVRCSLLLILGGIGKYVVSFRVGELPEAVFLALSRSPDRNPQPLLFWV